MEVTITKEELYSIIKEAVRDVIHEEKIDIILNNLPEVDSEEMREIEKIHGKPSKTEDTPKSETLEI